MAIISQETWDNMPKEEKAKIVESYNSFSEAPGDLNYWVKAELEAIFGKENLQHKPKIRTWKDVEEQYKDTWHNACRSFQGCFYNEDERLFNKLIATYKIYKLIELGYGGNITEREWKLSSSYTPETIVWSIVYEYRAESKEPEFRVAGNWAQVDMISFHTKEQAKEFMSYPENLELLKQFFMIA